MITEQQMRAIVQHQLEGTRHFLVDVEVRPGDKVVVEVDDPQAITLEQLVQLNRAIRAELDAQGLDCELQVSSPGMGRPFKVPPQYAKHIGRLVVVKLVDGRTLEGRMEVVDQAGLHLREVIPSKVIGRPDKMDQEVTVLPWASIHTTQASLKFK